MTGRPALALGTVQFGLAYGVAGRGEPVPANEAQAILRRAWDLGIRRLDTAPAYGNFEARLVELVDDLPYGIVTKINALPSGLTAEAIRTEVGDAVIRARERLGERLEGILFHNAQDLLGSWGEEAWRALTDAAAPFGLARGVSCYDVPTLDALDRRFGLDMVQISGNALDQAVSRRTATKPEITLRSVLLQGLLLMPLEKAVIKVPRAEGPLMRWHAFCHEQGLSPLRAALSIAKGMLGGGYCVVGVDSLEQLEQIAEQWAESEPIQAPQLDTRDPGTIDPRRWPGT